MSEDIDIQDREAREAAAKVADYEHGWSADIDTEFAPKGLNEDTVRFISAKKGEPEWMLEWRLKAFRLWQTMAEPDWAKLGYPAIDYQDAYYYAAPKKKTTLGSLDELDPAIRAGLDGEVDRTPRRHHDDRQIRIGLLERAQHAEMVAEEAQ